MSVPVVCMLALLPAPAFAQSLGAREQAAASGRWEIEFHGGGVLHRLPTGGRLRLPEPGESFATLIGAPSRRVSTWFFGDGASMLGDAYASWPLASTRDRVVSVDSVITAASARRGSGVAGGVRLSRHFNDRLAAEVSIDYASGRLAPDRTVGATIEAARSSAFTALRDLTILSSTRTTATADLRESSGGVLVTTATLNVRLRQRGRVAPFTLLGGGVVTRIDPDPRATLRVEYEGRSRFSVPADVVFTESDNVAIRWSMDKHSPALVTGGGVSVTLGRRWSMRLESRVLISPNTLRVSVDAVPESVAGPGGGLLTSTINTRPVIQFSGPAVPANIGPFRPPPPPPSTLSGAPLRDFVTFEGRGLQYSWNVTSGVSWRF